VPENGQKVMQQRKRLEQTIADDARVTSLTSDLDTLFELAREGEKVDGDIARDLKSYSEVLEKIETAMLLSGENDARDAIVTIHPGAGGTESQDWRKCCFACICAGLSALAFPPW
jgi:peptide chain release factor 2